MKRRINVDRDAAAPGSEVATGRARPDSTTATTSTGCAEVDAMLQFANCVRAAQTGLAGWNAAAAAAQNMIAVVPLIAHTPSILFENTLASPYDPYPVNAKPRLFGAQLAHWLCPNSLDAEAIKSAQVFSAIAGSMDKWCVFDELLCEAVSSRAHGLLKNANSYFINRECLISTQPNNQVKIATNYFEINVSIISIAIAHPIFVSTEGVKTAIIKGVVAGYTTEELSPLLSLIPDWMAQNLTENKFKNKYTITKAAWEVAHTAAINPNEELYCQAGLIGNALSALFNTHHGDLYGHVLNWHKIINGIDLFRDIEYGIDHDIVAAAVAAYCLRYANEDIKNIINELRVFQSSISCRERDIIPYAVYEVFRYAICTGNYPSENFLLELTRGRPLATRAQMCNLLAQKGVFINLIPEILSGFTTLLAHTLCVAVFEGHASKVINFQQWLRPEDNFDVATITAAISSALTAAAPIHHFVSILCSANRTI